MDKNSHADWNEPFREINHFNDFVDVIKNWESLYEEWEQYNIYGMIAILAASLDNIEENFLNDEIENLHEHLTDKQLNFLIRLGKVAEKGVK
ncbi:hypothetical protein [Paenibacillus sp. TC-CSREp1]|uniref:hypothetical protein n=1 Tax=Paenibacillus sp. TC-CSREp1 TaxID=3410089 RepID=UPI003CF2BB7F